MNLTLEIAAGLFDGSASPQSVTGYLDATDQQDTAALVCNVLISGGVSAVDDPDVFSASGNIEGGIDPGIYPAGSVDWGEYPKLRIIKGRLECKDSPDTCRSVGNVLISGLITASEGQDSIGISASVEPYQKFKQRRNQQTITAWLLAA